MNIKILKLFNLFTRNLLNLRFKLFRAKKRKNMWIADVKWGEDWLITFLIFKNTEGCSAVIPENFIFLSDELKNQVEQQLFSAVFACMTKQDLTQ